LAKGENQRKSELLYNGRTFCGKSFCPVNNKKLTKITGGYNKLTLLFKDEAIMNREEKR